MTTSDGAVLGVTQIFGSAPRGRAFNVVLLAEGFTAAQQSDFNTACTAFVSAFRATPPYDELSPAINVFRVDVSSTDSGADDPVSAGGSGATARTFFDATFGGNGIRRLLVCNTSTALTVAAAQVPEFTVVLVVVNSTVYGGSGGSIGTYSLAGGATEIAIHEMGHTAYGLADEYPYYAGGAETGHDHHPAGGADRTQRHHQHRSRHAEVALGGRGLDGRPDDEQPRLRHGRHPAEPGADRDGGTVRGRALLPLRRFPARVRLQDAQPRRAVLPDLPTGDLEPDRPAGAPRSARARRPISVVARYPEHLDVFAVASDGRTMSDWWEPAAAGPVGSRCPAASPHRAVMVLR